MNEWDTEEYAPKHEIAPADRKLADICMVAGLVTIFLIACTLVYLGVEAIRYDVAYISPIFFLIGGGAIVYIIYLTKVEDWVRNFKGWRERRRG